MSTLPRASTPPMVAMAAFHTVASMRCTAVSIFCSSVPSSRSTSTPRRELRQDVGAEAP
jgi:hypothetical protein